MAAPLDNDLGIPLLGFLAGGTIGINRAVMLDSTVNQVVVTTGITSLCIGIAKKAASSGDQVPVQILGISKAVAGNGVIALGAEVMPAAAGAGYVETAAGATARSVGIALTAAAATDEVIGVLLAGPAVKRPPNS